MISDVSSCGQEVLTDALICDKLRQYMEEYYMGNWFYRFKFKYQRYAINNLAAYASICFALGYMMISTSFGGAFYFNRLAFTPAEVLHGQVWRIFTAILFPPSLGSLFSAVIGILIYYSFASSVESMMGEFEYNIYFFGSIFIGEIGTLIYYLITGVNAPFLPLYTHFAVFMALAIMYADATVLLFFILPVKIKYIALVEVLMYVWSFIFGNSFSYAYGLLYTRISIVAAFIPVIIFYCLTSSRNGGTGNIFKDIKRSMDQRKRRREWQNQWK